MNRLLRNAISIPLLAWLAGAAGAAVQSGMQCPINGPGLVYGGNSTRHAYTPAARRDRLQDWRKRRQQRLQEWRAQRRWVAVRPRGLRPSPFGPPPRVGDPSPAREWSPPASRGLGLQQLPRRGPPPIAERFPSTRAFPDHPGFARFAPPPGYSYGFPPATGYPIPASRWSANPIPRWRSHRRHPFPGSDLPISWAIFVLMNPLHWSLPPVKRIDCLSWNGEA